MPHSAPFKVYIVEDSVVLKKVLVSTLRQIEGVEIVGSAETAEMALAELSHLHVDLVTVDLELPGMHGTELIQRLRQLPTAPKLAIISGVSETEREQALELIKSGTAEVFEKRNRDLPLTLKRYITGLQGAEKQRLTGSGPARFCTLPDPLVQKHIKVLGIASSTGGPAALANFFTKLPRTVTVPILIVQHIPAQFSHALADSLKNSSHYRFREAQEGDPIEAQNAYIAPGGRQMRVRAQGHKHYIEITDDPPVEYCKPSADYLFESMAKAYPHSVLAVVLTGMGQDDAHGITKIKEAGGCIIAQDEESCTVFGMPRAAIETGNTDFVVPLNLIAGQVSKLVNSRRVNV